jgi:hypothetical protein
MIWIFSENFMKNLEFEAELNEELVVIIEELAPL